MPSSVKLQNEGSISFRSLNSKDFLLLSRWLNSSHVHPFWGEGKTWDLNKVQEKYSTYVQGYKLLGYEKKSLFAFIILLDKRPIGYIQYYNAWDFLRDYDLKEGIPDEKLAALDLFIGEEDATSKGIGPKVIIQFLQEHVWKSFNACLVDPDENNSRGIRAYEKAGFVFLKKIKLKHSTSQVMIIRK